MSGNSKIGLFLGMLLPLAACAAQAPLGDKLPDLKGVQVLHLEKQVASGKSSAQEVDACNRFSLTKEQASEFFGRATVITGEALSMSYYSLPCEYSGELTAGGKRYRFTINAGATGRLWVGDDVVLLGCGEHCNDMMDFGLYSEEEAGG